MKYLLFLSIIFLSSCFKAIPSEPSILSEEKLKAILKDIHLAESLLTETIDRNEKDSLARIYYAQIFHLHQVSHEDFEQSMNAYFSNPSELDLIYEKIIIDLSEERKKVLDNTGKE